MFHLPDNTVELRARMLGMHGVEARQPKLLSSLRCHPTPACRLATCDEGVSDVKGE